MKVRVPNMSCKHCEAKITKALNELGVTKVNIDLKTKEVDVDLGKVNEIDALNSIETLGYTAEK